MNTGSHVQRFMILGSPRTGSNFLLSLLSSHPNIKTYGELFNLDMLPKESLVEALQDPTAYLRRRVYEPHRPEIMAVGFKMFYDHLTKNYFQKPIDASETSPQILERFRQFSSFIENNYEWDTLYERFRATWDFLRADRCLAVIHLKRRNALYTLISLKTVYKTNRWWRLKSNSQTAPVTIHLDIDECCRYFCMLDTVAREAEAAFETHPKIELTYEDLAEKQSDAMQDIFAFLRLPYVSVTTRMKKQILAPPWETVDNYEQLKTHFRGTRWGVFFE